MCGIAGFVDSSSVSDPLGEDNARGLLHRMCEVIRHRGPDQEGLLIEPGVSLGMRRLSIVDLATGQQPIHNEDGTVSIVFNGEIYNFRTLRTELEAKGHRFATSTDTEAIVHAYEEWGVAAIGRLRGMFGLAIWDRRSRTLLVARDRVGIKPMHYAVQDGRLYFGSEIKSLLCAPDISRELDVDALDHYLSFLYTPRDTSIFAGVKKLPPGHVLLWRDGQLTIDAYWQLPSDETFRGSEEDAVDELHAVLTDAVRSHLIGDVPIGAFLSGGVDSSLVVGLMAEVSGPRLKTFSIGFHEAEYDELEHARRVAKHFGTDHHEWVVTPDALGILNDLVSHFDEPFADTSAIPTWYVSRLASEHVTVVLSGDGGDELFGGYDRYIPHPYVDAFDRYSPHFLRPLAGLASAALPRTFKGRAFLRHVARDARERYLDAIRFFSSEDKTLLLSPQMRQQRSSVDPEHRLATHFNRFERLPWSSQMMRFDAETYLPEDILTKVDRMSMAHSIESRVPLLDNEVLQFAFSLPAAFKIKGGRRKHVLKEAAARVVPPDILDRRKQGFGVPLDVWFRRSLRECVADTLLSSRSLQRGYFQPSFIRNLIKEHLNGGRDHSLRLWQLLVFERWHRQYIDEPAGSAFPFSAPTIPLAGAVAPQLT